MTSVCTEINCLNTTKISVTQQNVVDIFKSNNSRLNFTTNRQSVTVNAKLGNNKIKTAPKIFVFLSGGQWLYIYSSQFWRKNGNTTKDFLSEMNRAFHCWQVVWSVWAERRISATPLQHTIALSLFFT